MTPETRLKELGITLPEAPKPVASYIPHRTAGNMVYISGQIPVVEGVLMHTGSVPSKVSLEQAQACARQCAINALAVLEDAVIDLTRVKHIVKLGVFVCSDAGFTDQPKVANAASDLMVAVFGDAGKHARAAVGSIALPLGAPVEVEMVVELGH